MLTLSARIQAQARCILARMPISCTFLKNNLLLFSLTVVACSPPANNQQFSATQGLKIVPTSKYGMATIQKINDHSQSLHVYIEGDGRAWVKRTILSHDPTPRNHVVINLARLDPHPNVMYLARPCMFNKEDLAKVCDPSIWSLRRYSSEVVAALDEAISAVQHKHNLQQVKIHGYSGGGGLAVLVAALRLRHNRNDVEEIITFAGNLDLLAMDNYHHTTPLKGSLDPLAVAQETNLIKQTHYYGNKDKVVPANVTANFIKLANSNNVRKIAIQASHHKGWEKFWQQELAKSSYK